MGNAFKANANFIYWQSGAPAINPVFADNDWSAIIYACQHGMVPDTWVADGTCYKDMEINGTNYRIDIIGKNHDTYADGGTAPLTFQMHDLYDEYIYMNANRDSSDGWETCYVRNTFLPSIIKQMPVEVQEGIREVQKRTAASGYPLPIMKTLNDKLFLLSEVEVSGEESYAFSGEGEQYEAYRYMSGLSKVKRRANDSAYSWWERSRTSGDILMENFCCVLSNGYDGSADADSLLGIAFAFCF